MNPSGGLVAGKSGTFYGTTNGGGSSRAHGGTVFQISRNGTEKVLYSFQDGPDGSQPAGGLVVDPQDNVYGTTPFGGTFTLGNVYRVSPQGVFTVLYSFSRGGDGAVPVSGLVRDSQGNLYGTTSEGGAFNLGTVFMLTPSGAETVLHSFSGGADGAVPAASLVLDNGGNLYGTTIEGGPSNVGVVFMLAPGGAETVLHGFSGLPDGARPYASLVFDASGNLYGTTSAGGMNDKGAVFKLSSTGVETVLHSFNGVADGARPFIASLVFDNAGSLYGTTVAGGEFNSGTIFKLTP
jgi:uncharacterized repeat protein (TIGR03803 family)